MLLEGLDLEGVHKTELCPNAGLYIREVNTICLTPSRSSVLAIGGLTIEHPSRWGGGLQSVEALPS